MDRRKPETLMGLFYLNGGATMDQLNILCNR
jgi:hypothetical protein